MCHGEFEKTGGLIDLPIRREAEESVKRICSEDGKPSSTEYEVVAHKNGFSFLKLRLLTGRTHQIRVHLSHLKHPIVGDLLYGGDGLINRQALHAWRISFVHPVEKIPLAVTAPVPEDMRLFLKEKLCFDLSDTENLV